MPEQAADSERSTVAERAPFAALLVDFSRELRAAGLTVGTGDVMTYCSAMLPLDPTDLIDLYWAGRTSLVSRRDDIAVYDRVFRQYFLAEGAPAAALLTLRASAAAEAERSEEHTSELQSRP